MTSTSNSVTSMNWKAHLAQLPPTQQPVVVHVAKTPNKNIKQKNNSKSSNPTTVVNHTYRDCSKVPPPTHWRPSSAAVWPLLSFAEKLHAVLSRTEAVAANAASSSSSPSHYSCVTWMPHGRAFKITSPKAFEQQVLPLLVERSTPFAQFLRLLDRHGFKHITKGQDKNCYYHELFLRGYPYLASFIGRNSNNNTSTTRLEPDPSNEPDFYSINLLFPLRPPKNLPSVATGPLTTSLSSTMASLSSPGVPSFVHMPVRAGVANHVSSSSSSSSSSASSSSSSSRSGSRSNSMNMMHHQQQQQQQQQQLSYLWPPSQYVNTSATALPQSHHHHHHHHLPLLDLQLQHARDMDNLRALRAAVETATTLQHQPQLQQGYDALSSSGRSSLYSKPDLATSSLPPTSALLQKILLQQKRQLLLAAKQQQQAHQQRQQQQQRLPLQAPPSDDASLLLLRSMLSKPNGFQPAFY